MTANFLALVVLLGVLGVLALVVMFFRSGVVRIGYSVRGWYIRLRLGR
ncbi:MAG TPA: hypothetical protein VGJ05_16230 [Fimbriiglobus sp.]|jgi:hypothetical protein